MATIKPVDESKIFIQLLEDFAADKTVQISMLRLDEMHPIISGNKWFKLKYSIDKAVAGNYKSLLSFGGAYSNHLIACAAAAHSSGLRSVGIVRGEEINNPVLDECCHYGMQLHFISRDEYSRKENPVFLQNISSLFPDSFIIPEGGANKEGQRGAGEISKFIDQKFTHILLSVGTGTTFIGLRNVLNSNQHMLGFAPMKGGIYLNKIIEDSLLPDKKNSNWDLTDRFHFGGFGKINNELETFMTEFEKQYNFPLDRVYTAKMMFGFKHLLSENFFPQEANILCIHTGGLTGN